MSKTGRLIGDYLVTAFQTAEARFEEAREHLRLHKSLETDELFEQMDTWQHEQKLLAVRKEYEQKLTDLNVQLTVLRQEMLRQQTEAMNRLMEAQRALEQAILPYRQQIDQLETEMKELGHRLREREEEIASLRREKRKTNSYCESSVETNQVSNARIIYLERERERLQAALLRLQ